MENGVSEIVNHFRVTADRFQVTADRNSADHSRFPYNLASNLPIPIYNVPDRPEKIILVMLLTQASGFNKPRFRTAGEAVDFFGQFF